MIIWQLCNCNPYINAIILVPSSVEPKFEDDLEEEFEKEMASKLSSTELSDYYYNKIANELNLSINQVKNTAKLLKVSLILLDREISNQFLINNVWRKYYPLYYEI